MKNLRKNFEKFCYVNRNKGIPNLMLYLCIGTAIVYIMSMVDRSSTLYYALYFNRDLILQGQVWRLFTYVLTYDTGNILTMLISLICYYTIGRALENSWGRFRFNLYYLTGVLMMDIFSMIFGMTATVTYLNLSLLLAYATTYPNAQFLLFFIVPIKAWVMALIYLVITLYDVVILSVAGFFPYNLYPLIALANYFLFFGKDVINVIPLSWRMNASRLFRKKPKGKKTGTIPFAGSYEATKATPKAPYTHRCTVCGRTDVSNPELEFRYCSRCNGYYCYCEDHISNHTHIQ